MIGIKMQDEFGGTAEGEATVAQAFMALADMIIYGRDYDQSFLEFHDMEVERDFVIISSRHLMIGSVALPDHATLPIGTKVTYTFSMIGIDKSFHALLVAFISGATEMSELLDPQLVIKLAELRDEAAA